MKRPSEKQGRGIRVLLYPVESRGGQVEFLPRDDLGSMQAPVGGEIESHSAMVQAIGIPGLALICNANGIELGLPVNPNAQHLPEPVPGPFYVMRTVAGGAASLTDDQIARVREFIEAGDE